MTPRTMPRTAACVALCAVRVAAQSGPFTGIFKMTFSTADPVADAAFAIDLFDAEEVQQPHPGGDGSCALVKWVSFPESGGYQWHFVDTFEKSSGPLNFSTFNSLVSRLHGNLSAADWEWDAFMDFHTTWIQLVQQSLQPSRLTKSCVCGARKKTNVKLRRN